MATFASALKRRLGSNTERGASPASVIILFVIILMFAELIVMGGRIAAAHADISGAAREAARQGSVMQHSGSVNDAVNTTARRNVAANQKHCRNPSVSTAGTNFTQNGQVTVTVSCTVDLGDFSFLNVPWTTKTFSAEATEIVEEFRAIG